MPTSLAHARAKSSELHAKVIRCGCTEAQKTRVSWHGNTGEVCPTPRKTENLGRIAAWYRNPLRNLAWRLSQLMRGRRPGVVSLGE